VDEYYEEKIESFFSLPTGNKGIEWKTFLYSPPSKNAPVLSNLERSGEPDHLQKLSHIVVPKKTIKKIQFRIQEDGESTIPPPSIIIIWVCVAHTLLEVIPKLWNTQRNYCYIIQYSYFMSRYVCSWRRWYDCDIVSSSGVTYLSICTYDLGVLPVMTVICHASIHSITVISHVRTPRKEAERE